jgi:phage baseplate assembly protein W
MPREFLGVGFGFPVKLDAEGAFERAEYEESVRQSIWTILGTAKGERVMRPELGCGIYDLVFEVNDAATAGKVVQAVRETLLAFEPRIDVRDIQVHSEQKGEVMLISIDYQIRATNNAFNLVYPFYLESGAL